MLDDDSYQLLANPTTSKDHDSWRRKPQERDTKETCDKEDMELQYENQRKKCDTMAVKVKKYKSSHYSLRCSTTEQS